MAKDQIYFIVMGVDWASKINQKFFYVNRFSAGTPELSLPAHTITIIYHFNLQDCCFGMYTSMQKSGWSYCLKPEFYPCNPGVSIAQENNSKKDHQCAFNEVDLQGVP